MIEDYNTKLDTEIKKHKWIKSEEVGYDIGTRNARIDWLINYWGKFTKYFDGKDIKSNE